MSKKKGTAEKRLVADREFATHNMKVALWGPYAEDRFSEAREIIEGWNAASTYEADPQDISEQSISAIQGQHKTNRRTHLARKLQQLSSKTLEYVRKAIEAKNAEALRKLADIVDHLKAATDSPGSGGASADVALLSLFAAVKPPDYAFTFAELREHLAQAENILPPYDENFDKRVRRIIKKLGIEVQKKQNRQ